MRTIDCGEDDDYKWSSGVASRLWAVGNKLFCAPSRSNLIDSEGADEIAAHRMAPMTRSPVFATMLAER